MTFQQRKKSQQSNVPVYNSTKPSVRNRHKIHTRVYILNCVELKFGNLGTGDRSKRRELFAQPFVVDAIIQVFHVQIDTLEVPKTTIMMSNRYSLANTHAVKFQVVHSHYLSPVSTLLKHGAHGLRHHCGSHLASTAHCRGRTEFDWTAKDLNAISSRNLSDGPGSESSDPASSAQTCAWVRSDAPLSSEHGPRRSACRSLPSRSSHPQPGETVHNT